MKIINMLKHMLCIMRSIKHENRKPKNHKHLKT